MILYNYTQLLFQSCYKKEPNSYLHNYIINDNNNEKQWTENESLNN